jgi:threonine aldolase
MPGISLNPDHIDTNIIIFDFNHSRYSIPELLEVLKAREVLALATKGGIRFVTHKDIGDEDIDKAISVFQSLLL